MQVFSVSLFDDLENHLECAAEKVEKATQSVAGGDLFFCITRATIVPHSTVLYDVCDTLGGRPLSRWPIALLHMSPNPANWCQLTGTTG